jgi:small-conductance mechanosensitive channel
MIIGFFSLGIGIGMQSIAIDLISGLIVLAHKPIRINDYVSLSMDSSTITGHIQKILLLSTQIITDDQSVVHVRNANLLKANLENHTLFNQITKCFIPFSLSEVTDFEKAKAIILNVVKKKNEIVQSGASGPVVLLDSTNAKDYESSVVINLLFYMKNIELKQYVIDDIMKSIRQEFQKKGVKYMMFHDNPHK